MDQKSIAGFSKLSKEEKIDWLSRHFLPQSGKEHFEEFWLQNDQIQRIIDGFSENTVSNFIMPYGLAPNFLIDGKVYCVPMVIEESSVVAAASSAAKYWMDRGGFTTTILGTVKVGQVHFIWKGGFTQLQKLFPDLEQILRQNAASITANMEKRGGGISEIELVDFSHSEPGLAQLRVRFQTCDSMGANFINSVLENFASTLESFFLNHDGIPDHLRDINVIMSILSNHTPECLVRSEVRCPVSQLGHASHGMTETQLAEKFRMAVRIAQIDTYRAVTHNKGIYNGIDAVILATGNDFRATEAAGHAYASRNGQYKSLSDCEVADNVFRFWLDIPLALGTVGGLTSLHPLAKTSLEMLGNPSAPELMRIIASVGLAQNFAAVRSLVTTGIQQGHMKMHLLNILNHLNATEAETRQSLAWFEDKTVSFAAVREYLEQLRQYAE